MRSRALALFCPAAAGHSSRIDSLHLFICRILVEESGDLVIRHVLLSDEGKYQCVAHNMAATRESPAVSLSAYGKAPFSTIITHPSFPHIIYHVCVHLRQPPPRRAPSSSPPIKSGSRLPSLHIIISFNIMLISFPSYSLIFHNILSWRVWLPYPCCWRPITWATCFFF